MLGFTRFFLFKWNKLPFQCKTCIRKQRQKDNKYDEIGPRVKHVNTLAICLFGIFHSFGDVTIVGEGLHIFTFARYVWSLSSEGYLACHTICDTGHPFIMVISEILWHSHLRPNVCSRAVTTCFNDLGLWRLGFKRLRSKRSLL